jgi:hypothetical protein
MTALAPWEWRDRDAPLATRKFAAMRELRPAFVPASAIGGEYGLPYRNLRIPGRRTPGTGALCGWSAMAYREAMTTPSLEAFAASGVLDSTGGASPRAVHSQLVPAGALVVRQPLV